MGGHIFPERDANDNIVTTLSSFTSKSNYKFRGTGKSQSILAGATAEIELAISYAHVKFNGVEIIGGEIGDTSNLKVLDTAGGTYSTVANAVLNQFGYDWNISKDYHKTILSYDSDLHLGMRVCVQYTNNGASTKTIYVNYFTHEVQE